MPGQSRFIRPGRFTARVFNPLVGRLTRVGLPLAGSAVLETIGRTSGEPRTTPVNPLTLGGERYLLAPRGETQWVRNIRVTGTGTLITRRGRTAFSATELPDAAKLPVIREYLRRWGWEVGAFFEGLSVRSSDEEVLAVASGFPVFRIDGPGGDAEGLSRD